VIVVADASPLRYLILIEHAHVLPALYGQVIVPPVVIKELGRHRTPDLVRTWLADRPDWLHVQAPTQAVTRVRTDLGEGEREAIRLAVEVSAEALLGGRSRCTSGSTTTRGSGPGDAARSGGRVRAWFRRSRCRVCSPATDQLPRQRPTPRPAVGTYDTTTRKVASADAPPCHFIVRERWRQPRLPSVPSALRGHDSRHALAISGIYRSVAMSLLALTGCAHYTSDSA
jgi:hypothetical protein